MKKLLYAILTIGLLTYSVAFATDTVTTTGPGGWQRDGNTIRVQNPDNDVVVLENLSTVGDDFINAVLEATLSSGIDSHTAGDDTTCRVTRNSGDITKVDIEDCIVHIQGAHYEFDAATLVDPEFGVGENDRWLGYNTVSLVSQEGAFTDEQQRTVMPIARIQAIVGQTGSGSDISDVGVLNQRYLISEDGYRWDVYLENALGSLFETGGLITENSGTDRNLDLSSGALWPPTKEKQSWGAFTNLSGLHLRHVSGSWVATEKTLNMDNVNYDDGTDLTAMMNNNYHCSHTLLMSPRGTQDTEFSRLRVFWVHCQSEWSDLQDAIDSGLDFGPFTDSATSGLVPLAQVIVKKNTSNIVSIIDARPRIGLAGGSITTAAVTLQGAYNNSSPGASEIILNTAQDGFTISDNATPVGDLFKVNNFANTTSFFKVDPDGVTVDGGVRAPFKLISSTYTATASDHTLVGFGTHTTTLPPLAGNKGLIYVFKNLSTGDWAIKGDGSEIIDDANVYDLTIQHEAVALQNISTKWILY